MPLFPYPGNVDPEVIWVMSSLYVITICLVIARSLYLRQQKKEKNKQRTKKVKPHPPHGNIKTLSLSIAMQILKCSDADSLNEAIYAIGRYEWQFEDNPEGRQEIRDLKDLLDWKAARLYDCEKSFIKV